MSEARRVLGRLWPAIRRETPPEAAARPRTAWLAVVQARLENEAFRTPQAFQDYVTGLARRANAGREDGEPGLIAFPEMIGLGLAFTLNDGPGINVPLGAAIRALLRRDWRAALGLAVKQRRANASSLTLAGAAMVRAAYFQAFAHAARETGCFIQSGTALLPTFEEEAVLGLHVKDLGVRNIGFLFTPGGRVLASQAKVNLTGGLESWLGLKRASERDIAVAQTPLGGVGVLVCYDAFFESLVARLDALGAGVLLQPSANARAWNAPWTGDAARVEGEEWLRRGPASLIQGRANLRVSLNPMLVGTLGGMAFEGRSNIAVNELLLDTQQVAGLQTGRAVAENGDVLGYSAFGEPSLTPLAQGVVALAARPDQEAVLGLHLPLR